MCAYQGVRNVSFSKNFAYVLNKWALTVLDLDIDECTIGFHECSANATCVNTPGFYACRCNSGYTGNGRTCTSKYPYIIYFELTINPRTYLSTKTEIDFIDSQYKKSLCIGKSYHYPEKVSNLREHHLYTDLLFVQ